MAKEGNLSWKMKSAGIAAASVGLVAILGCGSNSESPALISEPMKSTPTALGNVEPIFTNIILPTPAISIDSIPVQEEEDRERGLSKLQAELGDKVGIFTYVPFGWFTYVGPDYIGMSHGTKSDFDIIVYSKDKAENTSKNDYVNDFLKGVSVRAISGDVNYANVTIDSDESIASHDAWKITYDIQSKDKNSGIPDTKVIKYLLNVDQNLVVIDLRMNSAMEDQELPKLLEIAAMTSFY